MAAVGGGLALVKDLELGLALEDQELEMVVAKDSAQVSAARS